MRKKPIGNVLFYGMTAALVLTAAFMAVITVHSQERTRESEAGYRRMEREYVEEARAFLDGVGCRDSGLTLTRVVDGEGNRTYTLTVHHRRIDRMEPREREELAGQLTALSFGAEGCTFTCHFLLTE